MKEEFFSFGLDLKRVNIGFDGNVIVICPMASDPAGIFFAVRNDGYSWYDYKVSDCIINYQKESQDFTQVLRIFKRCYTINRKFDRAGFGG